MRKLLLIRHAKSSWKFPELDDHERPFNKRGERDCLSMARHLADKDESLDILYSSTAVRALDFAQQISEFSNVDLIPDLSFYTFDVDELMEILQHLPDSAKRVGVVAHNPAITHAANRLTESDIQNVPTAGIVAMNSDIDSWQDLAAGCFDLEYFDYPKILI